ncbi:MAG: FkbM family methyltransferase, partial [Paracoccaceae bacterium]|nr:FkbM family methyltransferase [Paracoccaceae bacterium]
KERDIKKTILLPFGVGNSNGIYDYHSGDCHTLNTFIDDQTSPERVRLAKEVGDKIKKEPVLVVKVNQILDIFTKYYNAEPDFVKVDVEGMETEVITEILEHSIRPSIIEIENNLRMNEAAQVLEKYGYTCRVVMDSFVEIWFKKEINTEKLERVLS